MWDQIEPTFYDAYKVRKDFMLENIDKLKEYAQGLEFFFGFQLDGF
jgi:hypothetical protein